MDDLSRALVRNFIRYTAIPCTLGLAAMAAIVLPGPGEDLGMTRLLVGCSMLILFPAGAAWLLPRLESQPAQRHQ
ncbi:hypothetical protein ACFVS9_28110 [Streptomyces sp. NPDC058008]|uniref:hypothetical protein n=1 Tax=Streptomyces sp. NPDC058008 TaxID=3346303 RepID=UPI0036E1F36F